MCGKCSATCKVCAEGIFSFSNARIVQKASTLTPLDPVLSAHGIPSLFIYCKPVSLRGGWDEGRSSGGGSRLGLKITTMPQKPFSPFRWCFRSRKWTECNSAQWNVKRNLLQGLGGEFFTFKKGLKENTYLFFWSWEIIVQGPDTSDCCSLFAIKELDIDFKTAEQRGQMMIWCHHYVNESCNCFTCGFLVMFMFVCSSIYWIFCYLKPTAF